ncbi:hypothetical protein HMPREF9946_04831 [Acetobacteraceae bacterium AT-5844]|nr:hypothetical protein HMPREF9946_04831 [Acetobacteraceae bacterium AT-5844]
MDIGASTEIQEQSFRNRRYQNLPIEIVVDSIVTVAISMEFKGRLVCHHAADSGSISSDKNARGQSGYEFRAAVMPCLIIVVRCQNL